MAVRVSSAAPLTTASMLSPGGAPVLSVRQAIAHLGLPAAAAGVVTTLAARFGTDPGTILQGLVTVKKRTGIEWGRLVQMALSRPVVAYDDYYQAIRRYGAEASYVLRHPGQDLTDLTVHWSRGGQALPMTL